MDIYDGADWTEMDIDDLKAAIESFCAAPIALITGAPTRKIKRLHDADPCLLAPTSALERITEPSQTSRQVRKCANRRRCVYA
jgi:hypothetical protein